MLDAGFPRGALNYWKSSFLEALRDAAIDALIARFAACPSPMSGLVLEHVHGAVTRVGAGETAFPHRQGGYNVVIVSEWTDPAASRANIAWARETYDAMRPFLACGLTGEVRVSPLRNVSTASGPQPREAARSRQAHHDLEGLPDGPERQALIRWRV
jgi:hypothetical protein